MKLKPCPFCGSRTAPMFLSEEGHRDMNNYTGAIDDNDEPYPIDGKGYIICSATADGCGSMSGYHSTTPSVIWNRRLQTKPQQQRIHNQI